LLSPLKIKAKIIDLKHYGAGSGFALSPPDAFLYEIHVKYSAAS
jgi:hypothetical protein